MSLSDEIIAAAAVQLARQVPEPTLRLLAKAIGQCGTASVDAEPTTILQPLSHTGYRALAADFLRVWLTQAAGITPAAVSVAVLTAAQARHVHAAEQQVELVWTGPVSDAVPFRRTEQAILQVLNSAQERITLVSYAVYRIPFVCDALVRAARRGVHINVVVETPDRIEGQGEYSTLRALGSEVASCASVYFWPQEQRRCSDSGRFGILHVKCAVADGRWLFVSSANLTEYAFDINMELGVLITGGTLPQQVEAQFKRLITTGILLGRLITYHIAHKSGVSPCSPPKK